MTKYKKVELWNKNNQKKKMKSSMKDVFLTIEKHLDILRKNFMIDHVMTRYEWVREPF